ncbi:MAG: tRNA (guanosine(37)-N1)-methyltransferase TrmD [Candidatus Falkowbacteria bacterium]
MKFNIITIFPKLLDSYFSEGMMARALKNKIIELKTTNLRDFTDDKHQSVDDTPYGGGAGMLMKVEPIYKALKKIAPRQNKNRKIILLSAQGQKWNQQLAKKYSKLDELIFICGRYEGVDERVKKIIDEEISIGDFVLTGGELGAAIIIDSVARLLPEVLGNIESSVDESHSQPGILEYPQYTKPVEITLNKKKYKVPEVLLSGHHKNIAAWREKQKKTNK